MEQLTELPHLLKLLATRSASLLNQAELSRASGLSQTTLKRYLSLLETLFLVHRVPAWAHNPGKRLVKSPKVYVRDSGLVHALLDIETKEALLAHPVVGASWEGFALEQVLHVAQPDEAYFWATHAGAELDLLMFKHGLRVGGVGH